MAGTSVMIMGRSITIILYMARDLARLSSSWSNSKIVQSVKSVETNLMFEEIQKNLSDDLTFSYDRSFRYTCSSPTQY